MAKRNIKTLAVDNKFFEDIFEKERKKMQDIIGINNLSQPNFTKMIKGFKIQQPKQDLSQVNTKFNRKKNGKI